MDFVMGFVIWCLLFGICDFFFGVLGMGFGVRSLGL